MPEGDTLVRTAAGLRPFLLGRTVTAASARSIAEALLGQRALAGIGNEVKNEILWQARVSPWTPVRALDDATLAGLIDLARDVLRRGAESGRRPRHVYRRAGRPCPRCRTVPSVAHQGTDLPRLAFWCPACQPDRRSMP